MTSKLSTNTSAVSTKRPRQRRRARLANERGTKSVVAKLATGLLAPQFALRRSVQFTGAPNGLRVNLKIPIANVLIYESLAASVYPIMEDMNGITNLNNMTGAGAVGTSASFSSVAVDLAMTPRNGLSLSGTSYMAMGPWSQILSTMFRRYTIQRCCYHWVPAISTSVSGQVVLAHSPCPPVDFATMANVNACYQIVTGQSDVVSTPIYQPISLDVSSLLDKEKKYILAGIPAGGLDQTVEYMQVVDHSLQVYVETNANPGALGSSINLGSIWMEAVVDYHEPVAYGNGLPTSAVKKTESKETTSCKASSAEVEKKTPEDLSTDDNIVIVDRGAVKSTTPLTAAVKERELTTPSSRLRVNVAK